MRLITSPRLAVLAATLVAACAQAAPTLAADKADPGPSPCLGVDGDCDGTILDLPQETPATFPVTEPSPADDGTAMPIMPQRPTPYCRTAAASGFAFPRLCPQPRPVPFPGPVIVCVRAPCPGGVPVPAWLE